MGLPSSLLFRLSRKRVLARGMGAAGQRESTFDADDYDVWRADELSRQYDGSWSELDVRGKDVLDFGCGAGRLSFHVASLGARSILGLDLNAKLIERARATLARTEMGELAIPRFEVPSGSGGLDLPDDSFDVILCFDVLEHVMEPEPILREWLRVLRPGGKILVWWVPWWHPYGPHVESLVPVPWAHVLWSEKALLRTCAAIYDMPEYVPRMWDLDEEGRKRANKWKEMDALPGVNKLSIAAFERLRRRLGIAVHRREIHGFGGRLARFTRPLCRLPFFREYVTGYVIYELGHADAG